MAKTRSSGVPYAVESLPLDVREEVIETLHKWAIEDRRKEIAADRRAESEIRS